MPEQNLNPPEPSEEEIIGVCEVCGDPIYRWEDRYQFADDEMVHDDCMIDYVREKYLKRGE